MSPAAGAGYSGTPLAKKLWIVAGTRVLARHAPENYTALLAPLPDDVQFATRLSAAIDVLHIFAEQRAVLAQELDAARKGMRPVSAIWVSWPKKAAKVPTDITEDTIRELALPLGLVDVKVCAVSEVWSGLKLVLRKELR